MEKWSLIDEIGEALGVSANNRRVWRQRGVPSKYHLAIVEVARERGEEVSLGDLTQRYAESRERPDAAE